MRPLYLTSAIAESHRARNRVGLSLTEPVGDILQMVTEDGLVVFLQPAGNNGPDGMFAEHRGQAFAWINSSKALVRQRFTIAHEYAHFAFHDTMLAIDQDVFQDKGLAAEKRANAFAAELLAPGPAIDAWLSRHRVEPRLIDLSDIVRIGAFFGVSAAVALFRLRSCNHLTQPRTTSLLEEIEAGFHRRLEVYGGYDHWSDSLSRAPKEVVRLPAEMQEAAWKLFEKGLIDDNRLAMLLRKEIAQVRREIEELEISIPADEDWGAEGLLDFLRPA